MVRGVSQRSVQPDKAQCAEATRVCACLNLRKAARAVTQLYDQALQPTGLRSTQFVILVAVHVYEPATLAALARELVMDRTTMTRNLKPLETAKLIRRTTARDGRTRLLHVTDRGRRLVGDALPLWERVQRRFVERVGGQKWQAMLGGLSQAVDAARIA